MNPTTLSALTALASARSFAFQTGRRKLIFNSIVVAVSSFDESTEVDKAHGGICQIAEHSAVKRPHRIRVSPAGFEFDRGSTTATSCDRETQKLTDRSGKFFW